MLTGNTIGGHPTIESIVECRARVRSTIDPRVSQPLGNREGSMFVFDDGNKEQRWLQRLVRSKTQSERYAPEVEDAMTEVVVELSRRSQWSNPPSAPVLGTVYEGPTFVFDAATSASRWLEGVGHSGDIPGLVEFGQMIRDAAPSTIQKVLHEVEHLEKTHAARRKEKVRL